MLGSNRGGTTVNEAARLGAAIANVAMALLKKPGIALVGASIGVGAALPDSSKAALIPNGSDPSAYVNNATQLQGRLVNVTADYLGQLTVSSGVLLNSEYVLTAGHVAYSPPGTTGFSVSVNTSLNYVTTPGITDPVSKVTTYPGFDYTFNGPDISILKLQTPLSATQLTIAGSSIGEQLMMAGFGQQGTPATGLSPTNGSSEAWNVIVDSGNPNNVSDQYYNDGEFASLLNIPLNGRGAPGDSGGPVFDQSNNLVGIVVGGWGGTEAIGGTTYLDFGQPDVQQWIAANTVEVPEPGSLLIIGLSAGMFLLRRTKYMKASS
jgi:hypothetical protein